MSAAADALLEELLARAPQPLGSAGDGSIDTTAVVRRLAERAGDPADLRPDLNALCRKLAVVGVVRERYGRGWVHMPGAAAIDGRLRALLAAALLAVADRHLASPDEALRGAALKSLNAALEAIAGLGGDGGDSDAVARLSSWSARLLRAVEEGADP